MENATQHNSGEGSLHCYLIRSGAFEKKLLDQDTLALYNSLLQDTTTSDFYKDIIRYFLLPYEISLLKFNLNNAYYEDPFPLDPHTQYDHIAPSLRALKPHLSEATAAYPDWFFVAFPDVALWAIRGEGLPQVKSRFRQLSADEWLDGKHIHANWLNDIIQLYLSTTGQPLECKRYGSGIS